MAMDRLRSSMTTKGKGHNGFDQSFDFVVGIRSGSNVTRAQIHGLDYTFQESGAIFNSTVDLQHNTTGFLVEGYDYYSGQVNTTGFVLTVDMEVVVGGVSFAVDYLPALGMGGLEELLSSDQRSLISNITTTSSSAAPAPTTRSPSSAVLSLLPPPSTYPALLGIFVSLVFSLDH